MKEEAAQQAAEKRVSLSKRPAKTELTFASLEVDYAKLKIDDIPTHTSVDAYKKAKKEGKVPPNVPFIVQGAPKVNKAHTDAMAEFLKQFKDSKQYIKPGRGAQTCDAERLVLETCIKPFREDAEGLLKELSQTEATFLKVPWMFGYSPDQKSAGPEFNYLGSLKWQLEGTRKVLLVGASSLLKFHMTTGNPLKLSSMVDYVTEGNEITLRLLQKAGVKMFHSTITGSALLKVPWGFIVYEKSMNMQELSGYRFLDVSEDYSDDFKALLSVLLPKNRDTILKGSAQALLYKIDKALSRPNDNPPKALKTESQVDKPKASAPASGSKASSPVVNAPSAAKSEAKEEVVAKKRAK